MYIYTHVRGQPKFDFGAETDQVSSSGRISVSVKFGNLTFGQCLNWIVVEGGALINRTR